GGTVETRQLKCCERKLVPVRVRPRVPPLDPIDVRGHAPRGELIATARKRARSYGSIVEGARGRRETAARVRSRASGVRRSYPGGDQRIPSGTLICSTRVVLY